MHTVLILPCDSSFDECSGALNGQIALYSVLPFVVVIQTSLQVQCVDGSQKYYSSAFKSSFHLRTSEPLTRVSVLLRDELSVILSKLKLFSA